MKALVWLVIFACAAGVVFSLWRMARKQAERQRESEARSAALLAEAAKAMRDKAKAREKDGPG